MEVVVGFLVTRIIRESRPGFGGSAAESDGAVDAALQQLSDLVGSRIGRESALVRMRDEVAETMELRPRTKARVTLAIGEAVESEPAFGAELAQILKRLQEMAIGRPSAMDAQPGTVSNTITGNVSGRVIQMRDVHGNINF
ncbi:hypothetical protein [Amycolatopsis vancoresmycina]|uniref:Putative chromosome partition protein n=1 Tax=Amycolatopsis vancoresmycina DSM 44592 TaxID=1292037 RepID=R1I442_9PSEU|nr:hypothetical protein [Amycolatopsis vancoresmycina]EOD70520.1 putative chromosome partition protein [Amycolatopsis vancoresmycina DSM 44592]